MYKGVHCLKNLSRDMQGKNINTSAMENLLLSLLLLQSVNILNRNYILSTILAAKKHSREVMGLASVFRFTIY